MTGRSDGRHGGRGGPGSGNNHKDSITGRGGRGGGNRLRPTKVGINNELEGNVFDLGKRLSVDLLCMAQIKFAQYIGSQYGEDIMGELEMKKEFVASPPQYPASVIFRQPDYKNLIWKQ